MSDITPASGLTNISAPNPNRDGSGEISDVIIGQNQGTIVTRVTIKAINSVTTGMIRLYIGKGEGDTTYRLIKEIAVEDTQASDQYSTFTRVWYNDSVTLGPGDRLGVSTEKPEEFTISAAGISVL